MVPQTNENLQVVLYEAGIPEYMWGGIERYLFDRIAPGSFLMAVFENNLSKAAAKADDTNKRLLWNYAYLIWNHFPTQAHGSPEKVMAWLEGDGK